MGIVIVVQYRKEVYDSTDKGILCNRIEYFEPTKISSTEFDEMVEDFESNTKHCIVYSNDMPYIVISRAIKYVKVVLANLDPENYDELKIYEQMLNRLEEFEDFEVIRIATNEETEILGKWERLKEINS